MLLMGGKCANQPSNYVKPFGCAIGTSNFGETPQPGILYLPLSSQALKLDAHIVVGGRGVGKSFWTAALQSESLRAQLGTISSEIQEDIEVFAGFSSTEDIDSYPNADIFVDLFSNNGNPYDLWRTVILRWSQSDQEKIYPSIAGKAP